MTWWDELWTRLWAPQTQAASKPTPSLVQPAFRLMSASTPMPSPSASPTSTQPAPLKGSGHEADARLLDEVFARLQPQGGAGSTTNPLYGNVPPASVYMGGQPATGGALGALAGMGKSPVAAKYQSLQEVIASVNDWGSKEIARFNKLAIAADLLPAPTNNLEKIAAIWSDVAVRAAMMNERGHKITPWGVLSRYGTGGGMPGGPRTTTNTTTAVNHLDADTSKAVYNDAFAKALGRAPTKAERARFAAALKAHENKSPSKTTTTTTTSQKGSTSSSTSSGGMSGEGYSQFASDWAMSHNKPEAQAHQAAAYYMPAFYEALGAPV